MNFGINITRERCEKCKSTKDVVLRNVFSIYPVRLCLTCWRDWEFKMLSDHESVIFKALDREYRESFNSLSSQRKRDIVDTNAEVIKNLYPTLIDFLDNHGS